ncbi:MAG TPA: hypothetical protein VES97_04665, partial [Solirubrobacteraceae bacterium]|nr:hypothetical protein [Solirubrobacteraceae bacterium]
MMKRIKVIGVALMVMSALSVVAAPTASAAGPLYLLNKRDCVEVALGEGKFASRLACENGAPITEPGTWALKSILSNVKLLSGEMADAKVTNLGNVDLKVPGNNLTIVCKGFSAPTLLLGGTPGRSDTELKYSTCTVEGSPECDANSPGQKGGSITFKAKDELVYIGTKKQAENEEGPLGDLFT